MVFFPPKLVVLIWGNEWVFSSGLGIGCLTLSTLIRCWVIHSSLSSVLIGFCGLSRRVHRWSSRILGGTFWPCLSDPSGNTFARSSHIVAVRSTSYHDTRHIPVPSSKLIYLTSRDCPCCSTWLSQLGFIAAEQVDSATMHFILSSCNRTKPHWAFRIECRNLLVFLT